MGAAAGTVDSVIDVTHNVVVPFMADSLGAGWGVLNAAAAAATRRSGRRIPLKEARA